MPKKLNDFELIVQFFEKQAEWIGLQRHAGLTLAALYVANQDTDGHLSAEDIAEMTGYSRSNSALALSQLEALGLVKRETDTSQSGRGRKRILFSVPPTVKTPITLSFSKTLDIIRSAISDIAEIEAQYGDELPSIMSMFKILKQEAREILNSIEEAEINLKH